MIRVLTFLCLGLFVSAAAASESNLQLRYLRSLEPWVKAAVSEIHRHTSDSVYYGPGYSGHWFMQAHGTAFSAFAVLATDPNTDVSRTGMSKEELRKTALDMLRFALRSHKAGGGTCADGNTWGNSWISSLTLERMSFGIEALDKFLDDELRTLYRKVTESEAEYLLETPILAGLTQNNKPESNMWNGIALFRAAVLQPNHPQAAKWKERASDYLTNAISVPSDAVNTNLIDGKPIKDRFIGANMFETMGCNHHGYMNVGYMYLTLSNLAIFHLYCKKNGIEPPEALYHHAEQLWKVCKACTFHDGRFARIGGDTRIRYSYCQDYGIPVWLLARECFGDADAAAFEHGWIDIVNREQADNPTGWFMKSRLERLAEISPLYYLRVEGDKACTFAFGAYWHRNFDFDKLFRKQVDAPAQWYDEYHGAWFQRGQKRFASWCFEGALKTTGLCVPANASDMAEWQFNLAGQVSGMGLQNTAEVRAKTGFQFNGGFAAAGRHRTHATSPVAEGQGSEQTAIVDVAYCALPDDRTVIVIQRARTEFPAYLSRVRGLALSIPNDVFNGFKRKVISASGTRILQGISDKFELCEFPDRWLNVDDKLGVVEIYGGSPKIARVAGRQIKIHGVAPAAAGGLLYAEEICQVSFEGARHFGANETLFDCAAAILVADAETTKLTSSSKEFRRVNHPSPEVRAVLAADAAGQKYLITANFQKETISIDASQLAGRACIPLHKKPDELGAFEIGVWKVQ
ncbi:MAG: hypothetical protein FWE67_05585 [Planctomycetaceae bacterium]|nr:hypothetical protein [Planctomycetaceae bacterium]